MDGLRTHPWLDKKVLNETYLLKKLLPGDDPSELGDSWYNMTMRGRAFLFIKSTDIGGSVTFNYGKKPLFPKWIIYAAAGGGGLLALVCLFICCCYVRAAAKKKDEELHSKVKKYQVKEVTSEDKISRFKYGRQSIALTLPELADNGDEYMKPQADAGWGDQSQDPALDF